MADPLHDNQKEKDSDVLTLEPPPKKEKKARAKPKRKPPTPKRQPPYHVIIWNDEVHTYEYVIELLMTLFGHPVERAFQITEEVDKRGKGIAFTTHLELAELKR